MYRIFIIYENVLKQYLLLFKRKKNNFEAKQ